MHRETIGYISVNREHMDTIRELITECQLCEYDSHEDEIITEVDQGFLDKALGKFVNEEEYKELLGFCEMIKFYS